MYKAPLRVRSHFICYGVCMGKGTTLNRAQRRRQQRYKLSNARLAAQRLLPFTDRKNQYGDLNRKESRTLDRKETRAFNRFRQIAADEKKFTGVTTVGITPVKQTIQKEHTETRTSLPRNKQHATYHQSKPEMPSLGLVNALSSVPAPLILLTMVASAAAADAAREMQMRGSANLLPTRTNRQRTRRIDEKEQYHNRFLGTVSKEIKISRNSDDITVRNTTVLHESNSFIDNHLPLSPIPSPSPSPLSNLCEPTPEAAAYSKTAVAVAKNNRLHSLDPVCIHIVGEVSDDRVREFFENTPAQYTGSDGNEIHLTKWLEDNNNKLIATVDDKVFVPESTPFIATREYISEDWIRGRKLIAPGILSVNVDWLGGTGEPLSGADLTGTKALGGFVPNCDNCRLDDVEFDGGRRAIQLEWTNSDVDNTKIHYRAEYYNQGPNFSRNRGSNFDVEIKSKKPIHFNFDRFEGANLNVTATTDDPTDTTFSFMGSHIRDLTTNAMVIVGNIGILKGQAGNYAQITATDPQVDTIVIANDGTACLSRQLIESGNCPSRSALNPIQHPSTSLKPSPSITPNLLPLSSPSPVPSMSPSPVPSSSPSPSPSPTPLLPCIETGKDSSDIMMRLAIARDQKLPISKVCVNRQSDPVTDDQVEEFLTTSEAPQLSAWLRSQDVTMIGTVNGQIVYQPGTPYLADNFITRESIGDKSLDASGLLSVGAEWVRGRTQPIEDSNFSNSTFLGGTLPGCNKCDFSNTYSNLGQRGVSLRWTKSNVENANLRYASTRNHDAIFTGSHGDNFSVEAKSKQPIHFNFDRFEGEDLNITAATDNPTATTFSFMGSQIRDLTTNTMVIIGNIGILKGQAGNYAQITAIDPQVDTIVIANDGTACLSRQLIESGNCPSRSALNPIQHPLTSLKPSPNLLPLPSPSPVPNSSPSPAPSMSPSPVPSTSPSPAPSTSPSPAPSTSPSPAPSMSPSPSPSSSPIPSVSPSPAPSSSPSPAPSSSPSPAPSSSPSPSPSVSPSPAPSSSPSPSPSSSPSPAPSSSPSPVPSPSPEPLPVCIDTPEMEAYRRIRIAIARDQGGALNKVCVAIKGPEPTNEQLKDFFFNNPQPQLSTWLHSRNTTMMATVDGRVVYLPGTPYLTARTIDGQLVGDSQLELDGLLLVNNVWSIGEDYALSASARNATSLGGIIFNCNECELSGLRSDLGRRTLTLQWLNSNVENTNLNYISLRNRDAIFTGSHGDNFSVEANSKQPIHFNFDRFEGEDLNITAATDNPTATTFSFMGSHIRDLTTNAMNVVNGTVGVINGQVGDYASITAADPKIQHIKVIGDNDGTACLDRNLIENGDCPVPPTSTSLNPSPSVNLNLLPLPSPSPFPSVSPSPAPKNSPSPFPSVSPSPAPKTSPSPFPSVSPSPVPKTSPSPFPSVSPSPAPKTSPSPFPSVSSSPAPKNSPSPFPSISPSPAPKMSPDNLSPNLSPAPFSSLPNPPLNSSSLPSDLPTTPLNNDLSREAIIGIVGIIVTLLMGLAKIIMDHRSDNQKQERFEANQQQQQEGSQVIAHSVTDGAHIIVAALRNQRLDDPPDVALANNPAVRQQSKEEESESEADSNSLSNPSFLIDTPEMINEPRFSPDSMPSSSNSSSSCSASCSSNSPESIDSQSQSYFSFSFLPFFNGANSSSNQSQTSTPELPPPSFESPTNSPVRG